MNPGGQRQDPLCLSQTPPFTQIGQVCVQPGPQNPSGHTEKKIFTQDVCHRGQTIAKEYKHMQLNICNPSTHSPHSAFLMTRLDIYSDPSLGHTRRRCSYKNVHSLLQTFPLDTLSEFTGEIKMNKSKTS